MILELSGSHIKWTQVSVNKLQTFLSIIIFCKTDLYSAHISTSVVVGSLRRMFDKNTYTHKGTKQLNVISVQFILFLV